MTEQNPHQRRNARGAHGKIGDVVEASFEAWPTDSPDLGSQAEKLALSFVGISFGPAKVFQILKDQFASASRFQRIEYLFTALRLGFRNIHSEMGEAQEQVKAVNEKLESRRFSEAVSLACEEAARAVSKKKIEQMAAVLVGYAKSNPSAWALRDEDIATMIRDLAQLGDRDIEALRTLEAVHGNAIAQMPNLQDPHRFSIETTKLRVAIADSGIHKDDFLSACERLRGFGLAAEVLRNTSHMGPEDFCYRPTRHGLLLLDYFKNVNVPEVSQG